MGWLLRCHLAAGLLHKSLGPHDRQRLLRWEERLGVTQSSLSTQVGCSCYARWLPGASRAPNHSLQQAACLAQGSETLGLRSCPPPSAMSPTCTWWSFGKEQIQGRRRRMYMICCHLGFDLRSPFPLTPSHPIKHFARSTRPYLLAGLLACWLSGADPGTAPPAGQPVRGVCRGGAVLAAAGPAVPHDEAP